MKRILIIIIIIGNENKVGKKNDNECIQKNRMKPYNRAGALLLDFNIFCHSLFTTVS